MEIGLPWFMCAMIILMRILIDSNDIKDPIIWDPFLPTSSFPRPDETNSMSPMVNNEWKIAYSPNTSDAVQNVMLGFVSKLSHLFIGRYWNTGNFADS